MLLEVTKGMQLLLYRRLGLETGPTQLGYNMCQDGHMAFLTSHLACAGKITLMRLMSTTQASQICIKTQYPQRKVHLKELERLYKWLCNVL